MGTSRSLAMSNRVLESWRTVELADIAKLSMGETLLSKNLTGEGIPVFSANTDDRPWGFTSNNRRRLQRGDIVIGARGSIGFPRKPDFEAFTCTQTTIAVQPDRNVIDSEYLYYALCATDILGIASQQAVPMLTIGSLSPLEISLPPLDEQRRIAEVMRSVDDAISASEDAYAQTVRVKESTFANFLQQGNKHATGTSSEGWVTGRIAGVDRLPNGWSITRLVDVAKLESGHTPDRKKPEYWDGGDVEWISLHDTQNLEKTDIERTELRITEAGLANSSARLLPAGTVCFSRTATVGKCVIMAKSMATSQDFANFVCSPKLNNRYLLHLMRWMQPVWKQLASGSTHKTIYMPTFKALQIVLPPRADQDAIAECMDSFTASLEANNEALKVLCDKKTALMDDLLSGRVRVPA